MLNFASRIGLTFSIGLVFGTITASSESIVESLEPKQSSAVVMTTPLKIEAVTSGSVCGTSLRPPKQGAEQRTCLGVNPDEVAVNDTVGRVDKFIIGAGILCGVDERGVRCWGARGTFERPIQEILSSGNTSMVRFGHSRVCLPKADKKIHCYSAEQGEWVSEPGGLNRYVRRIPEVEVYGPYSELRDFATRENGICALDGDSLLCEKKSEAGKTAGSGTEAESVENPKTVFQGARAVATIWGTVCVLSDTGLNCQNGTGADAKKYHVAGPWLNATQIFESGYANVCAVDNDEKPMCVRLGDNDGETIDITAPELLEPDIRVLKFRSNRDSQCALTENTTTLKRSFICSSYGKFEPAPFGEKAVDFEVGVEGICVRSESGLVNCFSNGINIESPLPEDGSATFTAGKCRWNRSRFHCASTYASADFSDIKTVIGATRSSAELTLPCVIFENSGGLRSVRCIGSEDRRRSDIPELKPDNVNLVANNDYACAYGAEETACWGSPLGGAATPNLSLAKKIAFGRDFGCAKDQFGFVCWGRDLEARLLAVPQGLTDLDAVEDFAVGSEHVCAISRDKTVNCWGNNRDGQTDVPVLTNPVSIGASGSTTCATSDEGVTCWGRREDALLGQGQRGPLYNSENFD